MNEQWSGGYQGFHQRYVLPSSKGLVSREAYLVCQVKVSGCGLRDYILSNLKGKTRKHETFNPKPFPLLALHERRDTRDGQVMSSRMLRQQANVRYDVLHFSVGELAAPGMHRTEDDSVLDGPQ